MNPELRDNGDLMLRWSNGEPALKLQAAGAMLVSFTGPHPLDTRSGALTEEVLEAIRDWCEERLGDGEAAVRRVA